MDVKGQIIHEKPPFESVCSWSVSSIPEGDEAVLECDPQEQNDLLAVSCPAKLIRSSSWQPPRCKRTKQELLSTRNNCYISSSDTRSPSSRYSKLTNKQLSASQSASTPNSNARSFLSVPSWSGFKKGLKGSLMSLVPTNLFSKKKHVFSSTDCSHSARYRYRHEEIRFPHDESFITLNVSGRKFMIQEYFLTVYPETLLGSDRRSQYYDEDNREYFFDRDPESFRHIWNFYYTGKLHFPKDECPELFMDELNFFSISQAHMCDCCWADVFNPGLQRLDLLKEEQNAARVSNVKKQMPETRSFRKKIWFVLENPEVTLLSNAFHIFNVVVILISIVANITETIPCSPSSSICKKENESEYFYLDTVCVAFFTAEYVVRLITCPNRFKYVTSYMSIIDLLAILPYYINLIVEEISGSTNLDIDALTVLRILRIFRIFKVMRHSKRLQKLTESIKNSSTELGFILFMYIIVVVLCASMIYFAEIAENNIFVSIPDAMWYAVVTSTTIG